MFNPPTRMLGLTIASPKGGVGKTTVALNAAFALSRRGWRTLVVDTDPAGAIGLSLTRRVAEAPGLYEYVSRTRALSEVIVQTKVPELAVLPIGRVPPEEGWSFQALLADGAVLSRFLTEVGHHYHLVVFDTPSGFGGATLGAMRVSRHVICPVQAEPISARSVLKILDVIGSLREVGAQVELLGFLITMLQAREEGSMQVAEDLWRNLPRELILDTTIARDSAFLEASAAGVPLGLLRRRPPASALIFDQLAAEIEARARLVDQAEGGHEPISLVD